MITNLQFTIGNAEHRNLCNTLLLKMEKIKTKRSFPVSSVIIIWILMIEVPQLVVYTWLVNAACSEEEGRKRSTVEALEAQIDAAISYEHPADDKTDDRTQSSLQKRLYKLYVTLEEK